MFSLAIYSSGLQDTAGLLLKKDSGMPREQQVGNTLRLLERLVCQDEYHAVPYASSSPECFGTGAPRDNPPASKMRVWRFAIREEGYFSILQGPEMGWRGWTVRAHT